MTETDTNGVNAPETDTNGISAPVENDQTKKNQTHKKKKSVEDLDDFLDIPPEEIAKKKAQAKEAGLTVDELDTLKALVPNNVKNTLKDYAQRARKPLADVYDLFYETYLPRGIEMKSPTVKGQCEFALKCVREELFDVPYIYGNSIKVKMEFKVLHTSDTSTKSQQIGKPVNNVAYVTGVFQTAQNAGGGASQHQASFGILTLWNDAIQALTKLKSGKTYRMTLGVKVRCFYMELSKYDFEEPREVTDNSVVLPAPTDILTIAFDVIDVKDAEKHIGYIRLLQGTIGKHETKVSSNGKSYGIIELVDFSNKKTKIKVSLFDNPYSALYYPEGTEVFVICTIDDNEKWGLQAIGRAIVPLHEMPTAIDNFEMTDEENEAIFGEDWLGSDLGTEDWNKTIKNKSHHQVPSKDAYKPNKKKTTAEDFNLEEWL